MKCYACGENMKNVDDINDMAIRMDFKKCPKCGSAAQIVYNVQEGYIIKVIWDRE